MKHSSLLTSLAITLSTAPCLMADGVLRVQAPGYTEQNGEYTTSHVYIDEVAGSTQLLVFSFDPPGSGAVHSVEIFTNLNRRDLARADKNADGVPDGIVPIDGNLITSSAADADSVTGHYYAAFPMQYDSGADNYTLSIPASKTGAYRVSARYKTSAAGPWQWYGLRDHCVVVSPTVARKINLYEINVFNIEADGDQFSNRSTLEDLHNATGAPHNGNNRWDLDYLKGLGCNWLWFQPIHPNGIDGREPVAGYGNGGPLYDPGSPYAVKNFFEVNELMSVNYSGSNSTAQNRAASMLAWQNFVAAADGKEVGIMLDAPFNHTSFDVELAEQGVDLFQPDGQTWSPTDEIRDRDARFFSSTGNYGNRASSAANIAAGPDRFDFGKWNDVKDVFFGRYDALVEYDTEPERSSHTSEGDWFDWSDADWTATDFTQGGVGRNVTHRVWDYFAEYAVHWLEKTRPAGANRNSTSADGDLTTRYAWDSRGIDGLRCDFGQGLPPRAWEYMINVARSKKWSFVMMAESLDGGAVTYRSARHFDVLNENIVFPLQSATNKYSYRDIFNNRRTAYGQGLVLMNTTSHDEENYTDPWQALVRTSVAATNDGLTMVFPGQELGVSRTYGYQHYETNFGKEIAHFKRWNSMMPIWNDTDFGNDQLYRVYAGMLNARINSAALTSSNRWFLDGDGNNDQIHAVAKYETANSSPAFQDVVIAFANLDRNNDQSDNFKIPASLASLLGLKSGRSYNVKNMAAYNRPPTVMDRDQAWLWGSGISGADLQSIGFSVFTKKVPSTAAAWDTAPFEAQFLKLYDVTPPPSPEPLADAYQAGNNVTFSWLPNGGADDNISSYLVSIKDGGGTEVASGTVSDGSNSYTFSGVFGEIYRATVTAISAADIHSSTPAASDTGAPNPSLTNSAVLLLDPVADEDGDGSNNAAEVAAGTSPLDNTSLFKTTSIVENGAATEITFTTVPGYYYHLETSTDLGNTNAWSTVNGNNQANGNTMTLSHTPTGGEIKRFYRVRVTR
ncbi:MAG: hypothetical protein ACPG32_00505 [Akkermansiaceae bacterium]